MEERAVGVDGRAVLLTLDPGKVMRCKEEGNLDAMRKKYAIIII
jgi:hypothetical protein